MIPACTIAEINEALKYRHELGESYIIGIMFARYGMKLTQEIINECYQYWHQLSSKYFDMFWVGYGEYGYNSGDSIIEMSFPENETCNHFNINKFIETTEFVKCKTDEKWKYNDRIQLMLVNCKGHCIQFDEFIVINLEENLEPYLGNIRQLVSEIIDDTRKYSDISEFHNAMLRDEFKARIKATSISVVKKVIGPLSPLIE